MDQKMNVQSNYEYNLTPCKPTEPCFDYDPCESGYDITDDDLAIFLRNEKSKIKYNDVPEAEQNSASETQIEKPGKKRKEAKKVGIGQDEVMVDVEEEQTVKKRVCKKPIKNPFFTNRLDLSSKLPPPPRSPPQQFLPPVEDKDSKGKIICPKRRRKCKSKTDVVDKKTVKKETEKEVGEREERGSDFETKHGQKGQKGQEENEGQGGQSQIENLEGKEERGERGSEGALSDADKEEKAEEEMKWGGQDVQGKKRRCKKQERPPCRKKVSEISLTLQPRHIPALQRDLPPTSPKEIPEVDRQILLGCKNTCQVDCRRKKCKKKNRNFI